MSIQDWSDFGLVVGPSSGALLGLLFVAVSLNRDRVRQSPSLRASASQTLVLFNASTRSLDPLCVRVR